MRVQFSEFSQTDTHLYRQHTDQKTEHDQQPEDWVPFYLVTIPNPF